MKVTVKVTSAISRTGTPTVHLLECSVCGPVAVDSTGLSREALGMGHITYVHGLVGEART